MMTELVLAAVFALGQQQGSQPAIERLGWMTGCWELERGQSLMQEQWMKPAGRSMVGMARQVSGETTGMTESLLIREREGELALIVSINMGKPTVFKAIRVSGNEVAFENPAHDFPQRIIYRQEADGSMFARIEGENKGKAQGTDFPFKRAKCN